jgi:transcriptional regulator with XRE-family HTH domain
MTTKALVARRPNAIIRTIRVQQGLTVAELARRAGVGKMRMAQTERCQPAIWRRLSRLADVLGCTTDQLLGRSKAPEPAALGPEDRALLGHMEKWVRRFFDPDFLKFVGGWRRLAFSAFQGYCYGGRDRWRDRQTRGLPARRQTPLPKPPKDWFTGWPSKRQLARGGTP